MKRFAYALLLFTAAVGITACKKEETTDPFAGQKKTETPVTTADYGTIQGIYKRVLSVKCANPGCHDGTFEPDFRTIQSSYSTMVYMPIFKPDPDTLRNISLRAVPGDTARSWLWERLITNDTMVLGRMPSNSPRLPRRDLDEIKKWIMDGCRDQIGQKPQPINMPPNIEWYYAVADSQELKNRKSGWSSPLMVPARKEVLFNFYVKDDSLISNLMEQNVMYLSYDPENFDYKWKVPARLNQTWYGFWQAGVNTGNIPTGKQVYFRFSTVDPLTKRRAERPAPQSRQWWLKENWSFIVQ